MPAGMHPTGCFRGMGQIIGLMNGQGVHIGPDRQAARSIAPLQNADNARAPDSAMNLQPEAFQQPGHPLARPRQVKADLGMAVKVLPPCKHLL